MRAFVAVAEERHFRRAAKRLGINQPSLSRQIRDLEEELGAELFDRKTRPVRLTTAGDAFLEDAVFIVSQTRRAVDRGRRTARGERGHLSVAAVPWAYGGLLPRVASAFRSRLPGPSLEFSTRAASDQADAVVKGWLDIGFSRPVMASRALQVEPLIEDHMMAVVPEDHPLAERCQVSFEELASESFVSISQVVAPGFVYQQTTQFALKGLTPTVIHEAPDPQTQLALVAAGLGVGLHLTPSPELAHARGVAFVALAGDLPAPTLALLWRRDDHRPLVRAFLDAAREVARSLGPPPDA